ncbi:MAG: ribonuclease Y [Phycisphaerales bacterium]|nr:ribonuclease Y [Phycisphaerales bacterium]
MLHSALNSLNSLPHTTVSAPLILAETDFSQWPIPIVIGLAVGGIVAGPIVYFVFQRLTGQTVNRAKEEAAKITARAEEDAKSVVQRAELDADRKMLERKERVETDLNKRMSEVRETEQRIQKREDTIDRKLETLTQKEDQLTKQIDSTRAREQSLTTKEAELTGVLAEQREQLLRIGGMTVDEARAQILARVEDESRHDVAKVQRKIIEEAEGHAKEKAREITLMAVQRYATEHTAESTVRAVPIPSDDMKGRIIGREGRNIRAIEKATGVDIIVDDTPGVIVVSCFDKVRQAVAVESLQRLIADGRMHPSRIEEVVEKVKSEIEEKIIKYGKDACLEVNLRGVHPKVSEAMGKLHFRTSYGQNVLRHSVEVGFLCQLIADQLGLDGTLARRCGFLHDIGKAMDQEQEGTHPKIGYDFAKQHGEREPVLNAILGHHGDVPSTSFYTPIVMAADAISSARPGARRESMEKYIQRLEELQDIARAHTGVTEAYAIQAGREVRVMVDAKRVNDDEAYSIAQSIAKRVSEEMTFPGEIRVTVLRETRAIEIAR